MSKPHVWEKTINVEVDSLKALYWYNCKGRYLTAIMAGTSETLEVC